MDPFTNALVVIAERASGALRSDIVAFEGTIDAIDRARNEIALNVSGDRLETIPALIEAARSAVHARRDEWRSEVEAIVARVSPNMRLCPVYTPSIAQSHLSSGIEEVIYQGREMGEFLRLTIDGTDHGQIQCYATQTNLEGLTIEHPGLPEGKTTIPLADIHAVSAMEGLAFLVAQPLMKDGMKPYLVEISVDHRPERLADQAA